MNFEIKIWVVLGAFIATLCVANAQSQGYMPPPAVIPAVVNTVPAVAEAVVGSISPTVTLQGLPVSADQIAPITSIPLAANLPNLPRSTTGNIDGNIERIQARLRENKSLMQENSQIQAAILRAVRRI